MNRHSARTAYEVISIDEDDARLQTTLLRWYGESQRNMVDALKVLEKGEERRIKLMEGLYFREEKGISIEDR